MNCSSSGLNRSIQSGAILVAATPIARRVAMPEAMFGPQPDRQVAEPGFERFPRPAADEIDRASRESRRRSSSSVSASSSGAASSGDRANGTSVPS